ncbi:hypothetical protein ACERK3_07135 [Phycisphaerales bacterium AB-hyl4]|uniref:CBM6 domain-containing protein n=1 Tax=Natronomicrosphaera hydrolytica TaxID=3242702 RepID=A0ABV4U3A6_9BACT
MLVFAASLLAEPVPAPAAEQAVRGERPSAPYRVWYGINELGSNFEFYPNATIDSGGRLDPRLLEKAGKSSLYWVYGSQIPTWADGPGYWHERLKPSTMRRGPNENYDFPFELPGVALDEWANAHQSGVWDWIPEGLRQGRLENPHPFIAVWLSNTVREQLYDMGRDGTVDLFLVQGYTITRHQGDGLFWSDAMARLEPFKERGLLHKTVFVLGHITDYPNWKGGTVWDEQMLRSRMEEIKRRYPQMPGVSFFQSGVKDEQAFRRIAQIADEISGELWPDDWLPDGIYTLAPQSDSVLRLEAEDAGESPGTHVIGWTTRYPEQPVHQMWRLTSVDDDQNLYRIQPAYTRDLSLEAGDPGGRDTAPVRLGRTHNGPSQQWKLTPATRGFKLSPVSAPNRFLRMPRSEDGTRVLIGVDRGGRDQVWALNPEFSPLEPIPPVYQAQEAEMTGNTRRGGGYPGSVGGFVQQARGGGTLTFNNVDGGEKGGRQVLTVRYANGSDRPLTQRITVNGRTADVTFPPTGWWGTWERRDIPAPLRAGKNNTVILIAEDGGPHIDKLEVNPR